MIKFQLVVLFYGFMTGKVNVAPASKPNNLKESLDGNYTNKHKGLGEEEIEMVHRIVAGLNWKSLSIYADSLSDSRSSVLRRFTEGQTFRVTLLSDINTEQIHHLANKGVFDGSKGPFHVIIGGLDYATNIIKLMTSGLSEKFLFKSKWLVMTTSHLPSTITTRLDNIAYICPKLKPLGCSNCPFELWTQTNVDDVRVFNPVEDINICEDEGHSSTVYRDKIFPNLYRGFNGRIVRIGIEEWEPVVIKNTSTRGKQRFTGFAIDILEGLAEVLNFKIKYVELTDTDSVWEKLFTMLINKEIDIIGCPLVKSPERNKRVDFMYPVLFSGIIVFYKPIQEVDRRWRLLLDICSWPVVVLTFLSLFCTAFVLGTFQSFFDVSPNVSAQRWRVMSKKIGDFTWFLFGNLLKQGRPQVKHRQKAFSTRIVVATWCIFCLVLTATFAAQLVPALGVVKQPILFHSVEDLLDQDEYKWGMFGELNYIIDFLKDADKEEYRQLYTRWIKFAETDDEVMSTNLNVHKEKVLREKYAFMHIDVSNSGFYAENCDVVYMDTRIIEMALSFPISKNWKYASLLSESIINFHESGLLERWGQKWLPKRNCKVKKTKTTYLNLSHVQSVFILFCVGTTVSVLTFLCESCVQRFLVKK